MPVRKLTSEQRLSRAIGIMEALYAAGESGMTRTEICGRFDITGVSLDEILEIVSRTENRARASSANATASVWSSPVTPDVCYRCA